MFGMDIYKDAADRLAQRGAIGVIPTDTVYGVVCRAADAAAVKRLYALKQRAAKPGTVMAATIEQLEELGIKRRYLTAVQEFWPGAVSVVIPCGPELESLHQGKLSLAVRLPDLATLQALLTQTGALLTTSANQSGEPVAETMEQAQRYFGESVDFYVDGGDVADRQPSTVIRVVDDAVEVLRPGAVDINDNQEINE